MKIGEAGEAFFVFETHEDIPDDLVTSPILQPTRTENEANDVPTDRFGAKQDPPTDGANVHTDSGEEAKMAEPDFLDLDAPPSPPETSPPSPSTPTTERPGTPAKPSNVSVSLPSPPNSRPGTPLTVDEIQDRRADEALKTAKGILLTQDVQYKDGKSIAPVTVGVYLQLVQTSH